MGRVSKYIHATKGEIDLDRFFFFSFFPCRIAQARFKRIGVGVNLSICVYIIVEESLLWIIISRK